MRNKTWILLALLIMGCHSVSKEKLKVPNNLLTMMRSEKYNFSKPYVLYYYNGNCSLCYVNIMNIAAKLPHTPMFVITPTNDTVAINAYMSEIGYKGKVLIDTEGRFFNLNSKILAHGQIILVDPSSTILAQSDKVFDENTYTLFNKKLDQ